MKNNNGKAAYLETGVWAKKAIKEAKRLGEVVIPASYSDKNFNYIPKDYTVPEDVDYFHCTSNNTIYGTQMKSFPVCSVPMVFDMSLYILSKKINVSIFDVIYAGAQKIMVPA